MKPSELKPGTYRAQARIVTQRDRSDWRQCPGSWSSDLVEFEVAENGSAQDVSLALTRPTRVTPDIGVGRVSFIKVHSALLSDFYHHPVDLTVGVVSPLDPVPDHKYPAVYQVPGFGGDHHAAFQHASMITGAEPGSDAVALAHAAYQIFLDAESPNGHTLFADSANNGPRGASLVSEIIPELEKQLPLISDPKARILRGHSSGGWSTLWLALEYPQTFGATWSTSPDPVDFRCFQSVNIYSDANMYFAADSQLKRFEGPAALMPEIPGKPREFTSYRKVQRVKDKDPQVTPIMSARRENMQEHVLGPRLDSAQQWASWQAVFGPRASDGNPVPLFDPLTGAIDHSVAEKYRAYDIGERLRANPKRYGPIFLQRVRLSVGDLDNFFLNEAVMLLKKDLETLATPDADLPEGRNGYIKLVHFADHGTIFASPEGKAITREMLEYLKSQKLALEGAAR
jgi:hypothetical protein